MANCFKCCLHRGRNNYFASNFIILVSERLPLHKIWGLNLTRSELPSLSMHKKKVIVMVACLFLWGKSIHVMGQPRHHLCRPLFFIRFVFCREGGLKTFLLESIFVGREGCKLFAPILLVVTTWLTEVLWRQVLLWI